MTIFKVKMQPARGLSPVVVAIKANNISDAATSLTVDGQVVLQVKESDGPWVRVVVNRDGQCQFPTL